MRRGSNTIASVFWRLISIPHRCVAASSASITCCACSTLSAATARSSANMSSVTWRCCASPSGCGGRCSRLSAFHSTSPPQLFPRLFSASSTMILMKALKSGLAVGHPCCAPHSMLKGADRCPRHRTRADVSVCRYRITSTSSGGTPRRCSTTISAWRSMLSNAFFRSTNTITSWRLRSAALSNRRRKVKS
jgi:hypothetical protein